MPYRILALDGGGSWALIEVDALIAQHGDAARGRDVLAGYDLVAANSGGSLVLGGLVEGMTLGALRDLFMDETKRRSIFSPTTSLGDRLLHYTLGIGPQYSAAAKLTALQGLLPTRGAMQLDAAVQGLHGPQGQDVRLLIMGFDYDRDRATLFRSAPAGDAGWGIGNVRAVTLAEAVHASSNAPVNYFDAPAVLPSASDRYWDGALGGNNNPVLAAVTEALVLGQQPRDIVALSLGTGTVVLPLAAPGEPASPLKQPRVNSTLTTDLRKLATAILDDPPDAASFIAWCITGGPAGQVVRMSPMVSPLRDDDGSWVLPSGMTDTTFATLVKLDIDAIDQADVNAIAQLSQLWLQNRVRNQPIRMDGTTLAAKVGHEWFSDALAAWTALVGPTGAPIA